MSQNVKWTEAICGNEIDEMCGQSWKAKEREREKKNHWASCVFLYRVDYIHTCCIFVMIWWLFAREKKKVALNKPHQYKWPHAPTEGERERWVTQIPNRRGERYEQSVGSERKPRNDTPEIRI